MSFDPKTMILCSDPKLGYLTLKQEIDRAVIKVLNSGRYILGQEVELFEKEFAQYAGVKYAVGVACGTEALYITLKACGTGEGDEVITVSHTAVATVQAIEAWQEGISLEEKAKSHPELQKALEKWGYLRPI